MTPRLKISASFSIALALLLVVGGATGWYNWQSAEDARWVQHTQTVIAELRGLRLAFDGIDREIGFDAAGLDLPAGENLARTREEIDLRLASVRQLVADNPAQSRRLRRLTEAVQPLIGQAIALAARRQAAQRDGVAERQLTDAAAGIRRLSTDTLVEMDAQEGLLLGARSVVLDRSSGFSRLLLRCGFGLSLLFVLFGLWATVRELKRRQQAEQWLRESSARVDSILTSTADSVVAVDRQGTVVYANPRALAWLGVPELTGMPQSAVFPAADAIFAERFGAVLATGRPEQFEAYHSGRAAWIDVSCYPAPEGLAIYFRETTEKRTLQGLLEDSQRLAGLGSWEIDGNGTVTWSDAMFAIFERDRQTGPPGIDEFLNRIVMSEADRRRIRRAYMTAARRSSVGTYECSLELADGSVKHLLMVADARPQAQGRGTGIRGFVQDITQLNSKENALRAQSEELMVARDAAEAGARAKSEFLATMSHEIRTPMNGVIGMTALLLDTPLSAEQMDYVATIRSSGEALISIINDILDFSKIEAGRIEVSAVDFDAAGVVEECAEIVLSAARAKGLSLVLPEIDGARIYVNADPGRVRQVLLNLMSNAVKFTPAGEVSVSIELADWVTFRVRDTGIGIPAEAQGRLFTAFSQADSSTTRRFGGTGLGLAISRRLIELMGGRIGMVSELGKGSEFWFTLPAGAAEEAPEEAGLQAKQFLLVDRDPVSGRALQLQVGRHGAGIAIAASAAQALELFRAPGANFAAVLIDIHPPVHEGLALAAALRNRPGHQEPAIVLLVSHHDRYRIGDPAGITEVLLKPIRERQLVRCLRRLAASPGAAEHPALAAEAPPVNRLRVLVAEDNPVNRKVTALLLGKLHYEVTLVANGREAVEAVRDGHYDIVLMDCQMPEMDGFEATQAIRALCAPEHGPPIIALTANALEGESEKCLAAGMDDYVAKPIRAPLLKEKLAQWAGGRGVRGQA